MKLGALALTLAVAGCSTTATIQRRDGPDNEAEISGSDARALYVRGSNGQIYRIDRDSVGGSSPRHPRSPRPRRRPEAGARRRLALDRGSSPVYD